MTLRLRYSLRSLLILVTLVAAGCCLYVRQREFSNRASKHIRSSVNLAATSSCLICSDSLGRNEAEHIREFERIQIVFQAESNIHGTLWKKYMRAAKYPWLPVEPDPPGVKFYKDIQAVVLEHKIVFEPSAELAGSAPRY